LCHAAQQGDAPLHLFQTPGRFDVLAACASGVDEPQLRLDPSVGARRVGGACVCLSGPRCSRLLYRQRERVVAGIGGGASHERRSTDEQQQ
jgi:hypothetical protein